MRIFPLLCGALLCLLSACATPPLAKIEKENTQKEFNAIPGKVGIYVYQPARFYAFALDLFLDGRLVATTTRGTFLFVSASEGPHVLTSKNTEGGVRKASLEIEGVPGKLVFVRQRWHPRLGGDAASTLEFVDEAVAKQEIQLCRLLEQNF